MSEILNEEEYEDLKITAQKAQDEIEAMPKSPTKDTIKVLGRLIALVDSLKENYEALQISYHSCLHPTPYHEREWSKTDTGDWQYETISYLPLRKRLSNDNARLKEENAKLSIDLANHLEWGNEIEEENTKLKAELKRWREAYGGPQ